MRHHWRLFLWLGSILLALILALLIAVLPEKTERTPPMAQRAAERQAGLANIGVTARFTLTDENGRTITEADYDGRFRLVYLGFSYCPDVCPMQLNVMAEAAAQLENKTEMPALLFISLDHERDTADVLKRYTDYFHPDLIGLHGTKEQTEQAAQAFKTYFARIDDPQSASGYTIDHSSIVFLLNRDNRLVEIFTARDSAEDMAAKIKTAIRAGS